jgi:hypothetical protein
MERYKIRLGDGSSGDEFFESGNQVNLVATAANGGSIAAHKTPRGGHRGTRCARAHIQNAAVASRTRRG